MHTKKWAVAAVLIGLAGIAAAAGKALSPEQTVEKYLAALKAGDFSTAYRYISKAMTQEKSAEKWAKDMQFMMQVTEAKIFDYHVYPGKIDGERALVPNLLGSQDKYLNQLGVEEHELYTLIREGGAWKVDQQQIVDPPDRAKWFPPNTSGSKR